MLITIGENRIDVDVAATRAAYDGMPTPGPEKCGCLYCQNWASQRSNVYPDPVRELLESMGIKPGWETDVWETPWDNDRHYYSGWYLFVGEIKKKSEHPHRIGNMELWLSMGQSFSVPWLPKEGVLEIHFSCVIDWVLEESPAGEAAHAGDSTSPEATKNLPGTDARNVIPTEEELRE